MPYDKEFSENERNFECDVCDKKFKEKTLFYNSTVTKRVGCHSVFIYLYIPSYTFKRSNLSNVQKSDMTQNRIKKGVKYVNKEKKSFQCSDCKLPFW